MMMQTLANMQKLLRASRVVVPPKAKARAFVSEVIVIAGPEWPSASVMRSIVVFLISV